jgi:hypothetical protein
MSCTVVPGIIMLVMYNTLGLSQREAASSNADAVTRGAWPAMQQAVQLDR